MFILGKFKIVPKEMFKIFFFHISTIVALRENTEGSITFTAQWEFESNLSLEVKLIVDNGF
jgi:hypothetical protein